MQELTDIEFLRLLERRGIEVRANRDRLRINAPAGALDQLIQDELVRRKGNILALLADLGGKLDKMKVAPLTYGQKSIWLVERFHPGTAAYSIPQAFSLGASADLSLLQEALDRLLERHEILRSYVAAEGGEGVLRIDSGVRVPVQFTDLSALDEKRRGESLRELLRQESRRPFNLTAPPLLRCHIFRLADTEDVMHLNVHHILADEWSLSILERDVRALYAAAAMGCDPGLPRLAMQYSDYAMWEQEQVRGILQTQLAYWKAKLADAPGHLDLPFSKPRPVQQSFAGEIEPYSIAEDLANRLRQLARSENASPFMLLLAAFSILLHRYTGKDDFCIGSPISGRTRVELEELIGLFINTLVFRCQPQSAWSFRQVLRQVRDTALEAYSNSSMPFQKLVAELHPERDAASSAIFQVMFLLHTAAQSGSDSLTHIDMEPGISKFDITLRLTDSGKSIHGGFEYRTDLYDRADIQQFSKSFSMLLEEIVRQPDQPIATLNLLSAEERQRMLVDWNATELSLPAYALIHRFFERQAAVTPDAVAVISGSDQISYGELNRRANHLAHHLIDCGVGPEICVGICLRRSIRMIEALLAILKAGGAYVPLDPAYPLGRLAYMMEDSRLEIVVSEEPLLPLLIGHSRQIVALDRDAAAISLLPERNPDVSVEPGTLAYVIYTSGSTGRPKGVAIEHHSTVSLLCWGHGTFPRESLALLLASTSICFDLSVFEIFLPLSFGHTVVLAADALELPRLPSANRVTFLNTVPATMGALLKESGISPSLQCINLAGEPLPVAMVDQIQACLPSVAVFDCYGPTETTTYSTCTRRSAGQPATIGRPIANTQIYILDANLQPVPPGVPGQIYIGGEGVARGYLHQPELTAERFLTLDLLRKPGRVYKTGDLAKYRTDGNIEFLGRIDQQVKIRGFRIELGEVESVLLKHPQVADAFVFVHQDQALGPSLVAFVLAKPGKTIDVANLVAFQRSTLAPYMVANQIELRGQFLFTPNGKVDRKAMIASFERPSVPSAIQQEPRDHVERVLVEIWQESFGKAPIGIDDDFFALGGHSLLALRVFSEIEKRLGRMIMLSVLFQAPTIRQLASVVRG